MERGLSLILELQSSESIWSVYPYLRHEIDLIWILGLLPMHQYRLSFINRNY